MKYIVLILFFTMRFNGLPAQNIPSYNEDSLRAKLDSNLQDISTFLHYETNGTGHGIGLSLSYDIVKAHGGELIVRTDEGIGSEYIIRL